MEHILPTHSNLSSRLRGPWNCVSWRKMSPREVGEMVSVIVAFMFRRLKWLFRFPEQSFCVVF
ncbi:hypothetical protein QJS10_CPA02g00216 [Acorus calamus]|uniref:Uncharacterized protein n=1 Tax=Acorus calamus TaxID=4465 RepID=A0AAV9FCX9_ACOCL|nr:hypothetical protein QJS10_CPA02g00216 [Acorus calamus]